MRMLLTYSKDLSPSVSRASRPLRPARSTCSARGSAHRSSRSVLFKTKGRARDALLAVGPVLYVYKRIGDAAVGAASPDAPQLSPLSVFRTLMRPSQHPRRQGGVVYFSGRQSPVPLTGARLHSLVAAPFADVSLPARKHGLTARLGATFRASGNHNGRPLYRKARGGLPLSMVPVFQICRRCGRMYVGTFNCPFCPV